MRETWVLDSYCVGHHQRLRVMRTGADTADSPAARLNPNKVVSKIVQVLLNACLSCSTDGHNTDHGRDPDRDSENSQDASHLVSEQRDQSRSKKSSVVHNSWISAGVW